MIPQQLLSYPDFRFIVLANDECGKMDKNSKKPLHKGWSNTVHFTASSQRLIEFINLDYNIGIKTGHGNLCVIDFDNKAYQDIMLNVLPPTFAVRTGGSGLLHLYYIVDDPFPKFPIRMGDGSVVADIQCEGGQVVIPPSTHPKGGKYTVANDMPITHIFTKTLRRLIGERYFSATKSHLKHENVQQKRRMEARALYNEEYSANYIKRYVKPSDVLARIGVDMRHNPCKCPLGHETKGKGNFTWNDVNGLWHCFHCDEGGDVFTLVEKYYDCDFKEAKIKLMEMMN